MRWPMVPEPTERTWALEAGARREAFLDCPSRVTLGGKGSGGGGNAFYV